MGSGPRRAGGWAGRVARRYLLGLFMSVFWAPEVYGEQEPGLIELVADGVFSGYLGKDGDLLSFPTLVCKYV